VFINGDGASWIKIGTDHIADSEYVLDKFHMSKYINQATSHLYDSTEDAKEMIHKAIDNQDKEELKAAFELILKDTEGESKKKAVNESLGYLLNNWKGICAQIKNRGLLYGCSAESHISHIYSDRMSSRPLGWCRRGVDNMSRLRIYAKNGGKMLELVRKQPLKKVASGEEQLSCADINIAERRLRRDLGIMYGTKLYTVPAMISKMLSIKEKIWRL